MAGTQRNDLVSALRGKLSDDRASVAAFSLAVTANAKSALLELANGFLITNVESGEGVDSLRLNLRDPRFATIGRLVNYLSKQRGYQVESDQTMSDGHPSLDLRVDGIQDIRRKSYTLKHHIWSEQELLDIASQAALMHNPNYSSVANVPPVEHPFVLLKAAAAAYRGLAAESARRKNLEQDASSLLRLAADLETQYERDLSRLRRVIPVPKADESKIGTGDVIQGSLVRSSLRHGFTTPARVAMAQHPPHLLDPSDDDIEDTIARISWSIARDARFSHFELWRDTQPKVERNLNGRLSGIQGPYYPASIATGSTVTKPGTSKQVLGSHWGVNQSPTFDGFFFWTYAELAGTRVTNATFIDGYVAPVPFNGQWLNAQDPLEPDTEYYYRLYGIDINGEILPSEVKKIRTKGMRARFLRVTNSGLVDPLTMSPVRGLLSGNILVTIDGAGFVPGVQVLFNGKPATEVTLVNSSRLTCRTPAFYNPHFTNRAVDVVLVSPNGLKDILLGGWTFT